MIGRHALGSYLAVIEGRLRLHAWLRGAALVAATALGATVALVLASNAAAFSRPSVLAARAALVLALAAAAALGVVLPLRRLDRREVARRAERRFPEFEQRLLTFAEKDSGDDPFLELLAADAAELARSTETGRLASRPALAGFALAGLGCASLLIWLVTSGPGYLGHGAALLWGVAGGAGAEPFYEIVVQPGDATVRKGGYQTITASVRGLEISSAKIHARYASASKWEETAMLAREGGNGFEFLFAGLTESADYFVSAGRLESRRFRLSVVEMPAVKRIRVTYRYPVWTGVRNAAVQQGGDLRAVEGTQAEVAVETDRSLANGVLVLDGARQLKLEPAGDNWVRATVPIERDGLYHIAALEHGAPVRLTEDYFIEAQKERPPTLAVRRPGRDARVNPIEEVVVEVEAEDDFALEGVDLHYAVNGGDEKTVSLLKERGGKQARGDTLIALEDYKLVPGDVVALYATARDARATSKSDIYFLEAQPWEREYSQSQTMGGGGQGMGEGDQQNRISQRQKEIIAATWNQSRNTVKDRAAAAENARFLSDVQVKLRDQAQTLARRMRSRELAGVNQEFSSFSKDMDEAAADMTAAAEKLKAQNWREALPAEQRALQHLLRAEATFRQIQVAFGSRGQGGGGGSGGSGRDLENMFDLELDLEKNQYEAGQQRAASADQRQREIDEALQRLEQLARRQQELAREQARQRQQQQSLQQRWQQEMLRREAEELRRQMEQMARNQGSQQGQQGSQQGQQSSQQGQQGSPQQGSGGRMSATQQRLNRLAGQGGASAGDRRIQEALDRIQQAQDDMRRAAANPENQADSRRAAERLEEARKLMSGMRRQEASGQLDDLARRAEELAAAQRGHADQLRKMFAGSSGQGQEAKKQAAERQAADRSEVNRIAGEKDRMVEDLQRLETDMQGAARDLAGGERPASSKVREALGQLQQNEIALRMRYNAEYLRRGYGSSTWMREIPVTEGLETLREQLRQARAALGGGGGGQPGRTDELERGLAEVERLRGQLQQFAGGPRNGDWRAAMNRGDLTWNGPAPGSERAYRDGLRQLQALVRNFRDDPQAARDIQEAIRELERLDPAKFPGNPELVARLRDQVLPSIEQLELLLRRKLDERDAGQVRSSSGERIPPGYGAAVAEYYRRLSRSR
jgi:hypothetical protein